MSFEESLIVNASPTLADLKVANLYNFRFTSDRECRTTLEHFNSVMNPKGIHIALLKSKKDFYLVYVYRKNRLFKDLQNEKIRKFLAQKGYCEQFTPDECINLLKDRLAADEAFPHEIGLFLGYPLEDVETFIERKGKDCLLCGDWKVYHNKEAALCQFCKYRHCKENYLRVYRGGRKFADMLV